MLRHIFLYVIAISISLVLGLTVWQSTRYHALKREIERNNTLQMDLVEQNRRLITEIAALSSPARIGELAKNLGLGKQRPEDRVLVTIHE